MGEDALVFEIHLAFGGLFQSENAAADGRLSASGFSHKPHGFPFLDKEADPIDGLYRREFLFQETAIGEKVFFKRLTVRRLSLFILPAP